MLVLTVVQRAFGFLRNVLFCRLMSPADLGIWNLAETTLVLTAPLLVVGVPGCLNRYVEHYRVRGQLNAFIKRIFLVSGSLVVVGTTLMLAFQSQLVLLAFGDSNYRRTFTIIVGVVVIVVAYNLLDEMLVAMRRVRLVSFVRFGNSLAFNLLAIGMLVGTNLRADGVLVAYGLAYLVTLLCAAVYLKPVWGEIATSNKSLSHAKLWPRILPFAGFLWMTDFLENSFEAVDRYMIIHFSGLSDAHALELVGQYHCSRIIGVLLVSVANMFANILVPYLSEDWERDRSLVSRKMNFTIKLVALAIVSVSVAIVSASPVIFNSLLDNRYSDGFQVLPCTMLYCVWFGITMLCHSYLFCAEKSWLPTIGIAAGLVTNLVLNTLWLPAYGLSGAVWATTLANLISLTLCLTFCWKHGMRVTSGLVTVVFLFPLILLLPPLPSAIAAFGFLAAASFPGLVFSSDELSQVVETIRSKMGTE